MKPPIKPTRMNTFLFLYLSDKSPQKISAGTDAEDAIADVIPTSNTLRPR